MTKIQQEKLGNLRRFGRQFLKFGVVGVSNTAVSLAVYYVCLWLGWHYLVAHVMAWLLSVLNAFYWNYRYVFETKTPWPRALWKTYVSYGGSFLLSMGLLYVLVDQVGLSEIVAPFAVLVLTVPLNFLMNKFWAFR